MTLTFHIKSGMSYQETPDPLNSTLSGLIVGRKIKKVQGKKTREIK